jgi:hypothetical protein
VSDNRITDENGKNSEGSGHDVIQVPAWQGGIDEYYGNLNQDGR